MSAGPPRSPRWKRRIRRILAGVVAAPVVLLLLGNLALATPWTRGWVGRQISTRTGVEAAVGRLWCTPWGGVTVGDLTLRQPPALQSALGEPLLEVRRIRVAPRWEELLKGKLKAAEIHIDGPRAVVAVEMLANLASTGAAPPVPAGPPAVAVLPSSPSAGVVDPAAPQVPPVPAPPTVPRLKPLDAAPVDLPETTWVVVTDARIQFRSAAMTAVLGEISGLEARIPVAGKAAPSVITLARVDLLGRSVASRVSLPLAWKPPELRVGPTKLRVAGLELKFTAVAGRLPGTPFAVEATVPPQPFVGSPFFDRLRPAADQVEARVQGIGLLSFPSSWQGLVQATAARPVFLSGGEVRRFDEWRTTAVLQGGVLQCPDLRLMGERLSLLGNGRVDGKGQGSAVLRMVVPPGHATEISRRFTIPGVTGGPVFQPLETPDRVFLDLRWFSYSGGHGIELGEGGPVIPPGEFGRLVSPGAN